MQDSSDDGSEGDARTANHEFHTPSPGTPDWHEPLNANWESLDAGVEIRDLEENRSEYTATDGAKFFATDSGAIFLGNGEAWSRVSTGGESGGLTEIATGTLSHTGGGSTAVVLEAVTTDELATIDVVVGLASAPDWDGDYGYSYDWGRQWNDEEGHVDVLVTVTWQPDPGEGNDLEMSYGVQVR